MNRYFSSGMAEGSAVNWPCFLSRRVEISLIFPVNAKKIHYRSCRIACSASRIGSELGS